MATKSKDTTDPTAVSDINSLEDPVRVRDLPGAHENPNIPRSLFVDQVAEAVISDDDYVSYVDGQSAPGTGFKSKSVTMQAVQMKHPFDANGESGSAGDWLVHWNGHWMVVKDSDM